MNATRLKRRMMHSPVLILLIALAAGPLTCGAAPAPASVEGIVAHHLAAAARGDVDALMADYAPDAVLITPDAAIRGKSRIRAVFERLIGGAVPPGQEPGALQVLKQVFRDRVGYLVWVQHAGTSQEVHGSDTFLIRGGKIIAQTVVMFPTVTATPGRH